MTPLSISTPEATHERLDRSGSSIASFERRRAHPEIASVNVNANGMSTNDPLCVCVGGGDVVSLGGGEVSVGGGEVSVGGGEVSVGGGEVSVGGGEVSVGGGEVSVGGVVSRRRRRGLGGRRRGLGGRRRGLGGRRRCLGGRRRCLGRAAAGSRAAALSRGRRRCLGRRRRCLGGRRRRLWGSGLGEGSGSGLGEGSGSGLGEGSGSGLGEGSGGTSLSSMISPKSATRRAWVWSGSDDQIEANCSRSSWSNVVRSTPAASAAARSSISADAISAICAFVALGSADWSSVSWSHAATMCARPSTVGTSDGVVLLRASTKASAMIDATASPWSRSAHRLPALRFGLATAAAPAVATPISDAASAASHRTPPPRPQWLSRGPPPRSRAP